MKKLTLIVAVILSATSFVCAQDTPLLMRTPTMNKTHIVFSYAGDLWSVGRDGGEASRLTTGVGREFSPLFRRLASPPSRPTDHKSPAYEKTMCEASRLTTGVGREFRRL